MGTLDFAGRGRRRLVWAAAALGGAFSLAGGCADPIGEFEEFGARCEEQKQEMRFDGGTTCDPSPTCNVDVTCDEPPVGSIDGTYLLSISPVIATSRPILFEVTLSTVAADGTALIFNLQPIAAFDQPDEGIVARKSPVGEPFEVGPIPIRGGIMDQDFPTLVVSGDANPVTVGSEIEATVSLFSCQEDVQGNSAGGFCGVADFYCGNATGQVTRPTPLGLEGSTWTLERIVDGKLAREGNPELGTVNPYINCQKEESGPPPPPP